MVNVHVNAHSCHFLVYRARVSLLQMRHFFFSLSFLLDATFSCALSSCYVGDGGKQEARREEKKKDEDGDHYLRRSFCVYLSSKIER